jgi:hypothetical protein
VLHLSGISLAISDSACAAASPRSRPRGPPGTKVSFDTNLRLKLWSIDRARTVMSDVMRLADICLPSYDDVRAISGIEDDDALVDHCLRLGAKTGGAEAGRSRRDRRRCRPAPSHPAVPRAGRSTPPAPATPSAALRRPPDRRRSLADAGRYAAAAAALSTEGYGAVAPIPRAEVRAALEAGRMSGRRVLVTGATSGIGAGIAAPSRRGRRGRRHRRHRRRGRGGARHARHRGAALDVRDGAAGRALVDGPRRARRRRQLRRHHPPRRGARPGRFAETRRHQPHRHDARLRAARPG